MGEVFLIYLQFFLPDTSTLPAWAIGRPIRKGAPIDQSLVLVYRGGGDSSAGVFVHMGGVICRIFGHEIEQSLQLNRRI